MYLLDSSRTRKIQFIIVWNVYSSLLVYTVFILKYIHICIYNYIYIIFSYIKPTPELFVRLPKGIDYKLYFTWLNINIV